MKSTGSELEKMAHVSNYVGFCFETGRFFAKHDTRRFKAGRFIGHLHKEGYWVSSIACVKNIKLHRLAWYVIHGSMPPDGYTVFHKDGDRSNNRPGNLISVEMAASIRAIDLISYDPDSGKFSWKYLVGVTGKIFSGSPGWINCDGYLRFNDGRSEIFAHRLAFEVMNGQALPDDIDVDHMNGVRDDNRWCNLRQVVRTQNCMNAGLKSNNTSGHKGVYWDNSRGQWCAEIKAYGQRWRLGRFNSLEAAVQARMAKEAEVFGKYSVHEREA